MSFVLQGNIKYWMEGEFQAKCKMGKSFREYFAFFALICFAKNRKIETKYVKISHF